MLRPLKIEYLLSVSRAAYLTVFVGICIVQVFFVPRLHAQTAQMLTVTPPLYQISVNPGQLWQSTLKVVNSNDYPLTIYTEVVNFEAQGEAGQGKFIPIIGDSTERMTLAEWIEIGNGPYVIPPEQTIDISFFVEVPKDAPPGGHFAAILVSTEPPKISGDMIALKTSQAITSLFFMRVEGDVVEKGDVREFSVLDRSLELPEAQFSLRFENRGNVLLQPRGAILITNMWGKERGVIPINSQTHFGNVLPKSIRNFNFTWKGEKSLTEIGRYRAEVSLAFGEQGSQSTNAVAYFWIIPIRATLLTLFAIGLFVAAVTWMVRRYVRNMLILAGVDVDAERIRVREERDIARTTSRTARQTATLPLEVGAKELQKRLTSRSALFEVPGAIGEFIWQYKVFFGSVLFLIASFIAIVLYVNDASEGTKDYEVTITEGGTPRTLTDDEVRSVQGE